MEEEKQSEGQVEKGVDEHEERAEEREVSIILVVRHVSSPIEGDAKRRTRSTRGNTTGLVAGLRSPMFWICLRQERRRTRRKETHKRCQGHTARITPGRSSQTSPTVIDLLATDVRAPWRVTMEACTNPILFKHGRRSTIHAQMIGWGGSTV